MGTGGSPLSGDLGSFVPIRKKNVSRASEDHGEEAEDEREDDGYEEEIEEAEDEGEDDEAMGEVLLPGMSGPNPGQPRDIENGNSGASGGGSGFFGSMEMDDNSGDKTEEDLDPDPQTEEVATTTDAGDIGGSTTDDGARRRGTMAAAVPPKRASKAPAPPTTPTPGQVTKNSTKESVRERERKRKEARDKVMMPPPQTVKRNLNTTAVGGVKPPRGKEATPGTRVRGASTTADSTPATTSGLSRSTSVRRGSVAKEEGNMGPVSKSRGSFDTKTLANPAGSNTQAARHSRTRSVTSASAPRPKNSNSANANTTGTDSEDPAAAKRSAVPVGTTKKPRPASMYVPSTKPITDMEPDGPSSPTHVVPTIIRSRQQSTSKDSPVASMARKATTKTAASHRRNQSEVQAIERKHARPEFTTLQKDYSAPILPGASSLPTTSTNTILLDAPTLQKQTHLLQLILLHDTAIQSFQSFHVDAHAKLSKRHRATVELYQNTRGRLVADAHAADMYMLRKVLQSEPAVPPAGGVARWGTAAGRRLSGSREHLAGGGARRKTLTGDIASPVEERIQVFSESLKRIEGLLRKGGDVSRVRVAWDAWVAAWKAGNASEDGLPKQWHRDWATTKRKVEVAMDGVRDFWVAYQHVMSEKQQKRFVSSAMTEKGLGSGGGGDGGDDGDGDGEGNEGVRGGTLFRMVIGFLELGEDVVRELDEMKALERVFLEEARERMRAVVREVLAEKVVIEGMEGSEVVEGVEVEVAGASQGVGKAWRM